MGEEDGGSDRPKVNNSAARPNIYAAWSLKREERDFCRRAPTALQVGSKKGNFFLLALKNQIPCCDIYHLSHSFTKSNNCPQTITSFLVLSWNPAVLWGFWNNQNQCFFHSDFFSHTQNCGCLVLISSNPQNRLLASEFLNYLELVFIKKHQMPTQHWILNHISFARPYGEF